MSSFNYFKHYFYDHNFTKEEILSYLRGYVSSYGRKSSKDELLCLISDVKMILEISRDLASDLDKYTRWRLNNDV